MQRLAKRKREYLEPVSVVDLTRDEPEADGAAANAMKRERHASPLPSADAEAIARGTDDDSTSAI